MSLNDEERAALVALEMEKAQKLLVDAEQIAALQIWDTVANRLYYAAFHAASALMIHDGHPVNSHRGMVAMLGMHYVKAGILSVDEGRLYSQLQTMRDKGDYNVGFNATANDVQPFIELTKNFVAKIQFVVA